MLRYGFETPYGGYFEQERNIALGEGRHGARRTLAFVRLFGSEHTQVDTIAGGSANNIDAHGNITVEIQAITGATNETGFNYLSAR